ncbi:MAG: hypothetical protein HYU63_02015 [Armatimonadetes bacterium]|nr:hypothetical protein [Armatimonadota bacterium]
MYLFLLVTLSLNIFMMVNLFLNKEYFYTLNKLIDYSRKNSYKKPVYAWDEEIAYYLGCKGVNPIQSASKDMAFYADYLGINQENSYTDISGGEIEFYKKQFNSVKLLSL